VVHDIPLLAETGQTSAFDAVIVVDVPVETQVERMVGLCGMTRETPGPASPPRPQDLTWDAALASIALSSAPPATEPCRAGRSCR